VRKSTREDSYDPPGCAGATARSSALLDLEVECHRNVLKQGGANSPLGIEADGYGLFGAKMGTKENQGKTVILLAV